MEYHRKGQPLPPQLKSNLENNARNIDNVKRTVESLRNAYHKTEQDYADIIHRLSKLEQSGSNHS